MSNVNHFEQLYKQDDIGKIIGNCGSLSELAATIENSYLVVKNANEVNMSSSSPLFNNSYRESLVTGVLKLARSLQEGDHDRLQQLLQVIDGPDFRGDHYSLWDGVKDVSEIRDFFEHREL